MIQDIIKAMFRQDSLAKVLLTNSVTSKQMQEMLHADDLQMVTITEPLGQKATAALRQLTEAKPKLILATTSTARFQDLRFLRHLPQLGGLICLGRYVVNLDGIQNCERLQVLHLGQTYAADTSIHPLRQLPNLNYLHMDSRVKQYDTLASLPQLQHLGLCNFPPDALAPLHDASALRQLWLKRGNGQYLSQLATATSLQHLSLEQVREVILPAIPSLRFLSIRASKCSSVTDLANCTGLQELQLLNIRQLKGLSGIERLRDLETLVLQGCPIAPGNTAYLESLRQLSALRWPPTRRIKDEIDLFLRKRPHIQQLGRGAAAAHSRAHRRALNDPLLGLFDRSRSK